MPSSLDKVETTGGTRIPSLNLQAIGCCDDGNIQAPELDASALDASVLDASILDPDMLEGEKLTDGVVEKAGELVKLRQAACKRSRDI